MIAKPCERVAADLELARVSRERLHDYYVRFCQRAMDMTDAKCRVKGIVPKRVGDDLYVQYLDRRLRFSFAFDRQADRGLLCVEDMSAAGLYDGREPVRLETISFDNVGNSDVVDSNGTKLSISDHGLQLALGLVDLALNQKPL
jgi:hypothetical protein